MTDLIYAWHPYEMQALVCGFIAGGFVGALFGWALGLRHSDKERD